MVHGIQTASPMLPKFVNISDVPFSLQIFPAPTIGFDPLTALLGNQ
jgi:hypothetical protein